MLGPISFVFWLLPAVTAVAVLWTLNQTIGQGYRQWSFLKHLPSPPDASWLLGQVPVFLRTDAPMRLAEWSRQYGGLYRLRFLWTYGVIVTDPTLVRAVLQSSKTYVPKDRRLLRPLELPCNQVPNILTSSDGDYWRLVRGAWMKCFTSTNLKRVLPILQDLCDRVTEQIKQQAAAPAPAPAEGPAEVPAAAPAGGAASGAAVQQGPVVVNMCAVTDRITLDVIGHVSYGRDFGAVDHKRSRYLELVSSLLGLMHEEMDHPLRRLLRGIRGGHRRKDLLRAEWDAANTAEVMRALADPPGEHTIAGQLLALRDPVTQAPLSLAQLKSELVIATLAGFETTSNALSWTLGSLAAHPQALEALEQELSSAGLLATPDCPSPPRFEWSTLGKLSYLQACIREGLRLFSPAANGSWRLCAAADVHIAPGLTLPKGSPIGIPLFAFGHDPATYGQDADAFRPDRWLAGRATRSTSTSMSSSSMSMDDGDIKAAAPTTTSSSSIDSPAATAVPAAPAAAAAAAGVPVVSRAPSSKQLQDPWTFSIGPRDCAGQALARLELQVVIAAIVGNFRVQLAPEVGGWEGLLARRMYHTTLQIEGGLPLLLTPRVVVAGSS